MNCSSLSKLHHKFILFLGSSYSVQPANLQGKQTGKKTLQYHKEIPAQENVLGTVAFLSPQLEVSVFLGLLHEMLK